MGRIHATVYESEPRRLQEREGRWLKLISGLAMVGLGLYLILRR